MAKFVRSELREILREAGATEENVESAVTKLVRLHMDVVDPLKTENDTISKKDKELETLKTKLDAAETELAELKKVDYKKQFDDISAKYKAYKEEQESKAVKSKKIEAYKKLLRDAGVSDKRLDAIIRVTAIDDIKLDKDGNIEGADECTKNIKSEWADFIVNTQQKGADTPTPPSGNDSGSGCSGRAAQRVAQYMADHYGNAIKKED